MHRSPRRAPPADRVVGPGFHARVFALVRRVARGRVTTYGDIAAALGLRRVARHVGFALAAAGSDDLPWHRVVNGRGWISMRSDGGRSPAQAARLMAEGVLVDAQGRVVEFAARRQRVWSTRRTPSEPPGTRGRSARKSARKRPSRRAEPTALAAEPKRGLAGGGAVKTIDEYLARLSDDQRAALEQLRRQIQAAAPKALECVSYQVPAFRQGRLLVGFGATARHCALYLMSATTVAAHQDALAGYDASEGTIRFPAARPLPAALVRKLVKARLAENAELSRKTEV